MKIITLLILSLALISFNGCKVNYGSKCPDFVSRSNNKTLTARHNHPFRLNKSSKSKHEVMDDYAVADAQEHHDEIEIKLPKMLVKHLKPEEIEQTNEVFS